MTLDDILAQLGALPESKQKEVTEDVLKATARRYFVPNAGPQTDAYFSAADELFYGGGAGGGKSALLCGLAIEEHRKSIVFRREYSQVKGLVDDLKKLIVPLNRGDYAGCRRKFDEFVRAKGKVLTGLIRRRDAEQALWDDRYDNVVLPEEPVHHGADVDEPQPKPLTQSTIANGATVGGGFTLAGLAATIWDKFTEAPASLQEAAVKAAARPLFWFIVLAGAACAYVWWRRKRMQEA